MTLFPPAGCPRRRARVWMILICLAIGAVMMLEARPAAARRRRPYYRVNEVHGDVAVSLGHDKDVRSVTGQPDLDQGELLVQEEINLGGSGWIYHPTLTQLDADFGLLLNQDFLSSKTGFSTETFANQFTYNVRLGLLPYKPYPMNAFASQLRSQINSPFTPRRIVDTFRYGGDITLRDLAIAGLELPSRAFFRRQETETSTFGGGLDSIRVRDEFEFSTRNETERTRSRLRYNWKDLKTAGLATVAQSRRHDIRAFQDRVLDRGNLNSQFFLSDNGGDFDSLALGLNENLRLRHDHMLQSTYAYGLTYQDSTSSSQLAHRGQVGVSHQLYESLWSGLRANGTYATSDRGLTWTSGVDADINYRKTVPGGVLGLRLNPSYLYTDDDIEGGILSVIDDRHVVEVGPPIVLNKTLVERSTIVIRDPEGLQVFVEGIDYDVIDLGVETGIQVVPGSELDPAVPPATPVMAVSYDYLVEPARIYETLILGAGANLQLWEHLTLDLAYTKSNQNLIEGDPVQLSLDDSRRIVARILLNFDRNRTRFEYENFESTITPRERYMVTHDFNIRPTTRSSLGLSAGYDWDRITDTNRVTQTFSFNANGTMVFPYGILGRLNLLMRWVDQVEQSTIATGGTVAFTYRYGRLQFEVNDRVTWRQTDTKSGPWSRTKQLLNTFFFRIVRPF